MRGKYSERQPSNGEQKMISPANIPIHGISYTDNLFKRFRELDNELELLKIEIDKFNKVLDKQNSAQKQNVRRK